MKNKILIIMMLILLVTPLASSTIETLGTFKQGEPIDLVQSGANFTFCNITSVRPTITKDVILKNVQMTKIGTEYNYTLNTSLTKLLGRYTVIGFCSNGTSDIIWGYPFEVTPNGTLLTPQKSQSFIAMLLVFTFLIIFMVFGFNKSKKLWVKTFCFLFTYLTIMVMNYMIWVFTENYVCTISFLAVFFKWFFIIQLVGMFPLFLASVIWYFYNLYQLSAIQRMIDEGVPEDRAYAEKINKGMKRKQKWI